MAGLLTDGLVDVGPASLQGVALTNGFGTYPQITGYEQGNFDTNIANGGNPQSVAASAFNIAALYFAIAHNTANASAGAATLSKVIGTITTETLTTAAGASYTLTLTNTLITPASVIQAAAYLNLSTTGGPLVITNITANAGSCVITVLNAGTAALSGTAAMVIMFQVAPAL